MSELLKKVAEESRRDDIKSKLKKVGSAFLNNREVSAQEAAYRRLSLLLKKASRKVVFVNAVPKDKRVFMLLELNVNKLSRKMNVSLKNGTCLKRKLITTLTWLLKDSRHDRTFKQKLPI